MFRSENEFVRWLQRLTPASGRGLHLGIGDDAALIRLGGDCEAVLTTDLSIEGVHFLPELHPPQAVGHRALARALSDIAAMGGTPRFALVSLAVTGKVSRIWIERFYKALLALARRYRVELIGGDTAVIPDRTCIDVVVVGEVPPRSALRRSGARPGDQIFVSGQLGLSALGLVCLRTGGKRHLRAWATAMKAHLAPQPPCALGRFLAARRLASAAIDLSDGLSTDLGRLVAASGVGARIWADLIPRPRGPVLRAQLGHDYLELALHGGEDYQLLFTVPRRKVSLLPRCFRGLPLTRIGEITRPKRLLVVQPDGHAQPLKPAGYDHFRKLG